MFVAYFSRTPFALGQMYFAPAQLRGNYLEFSDPESVVYRRTGSTAAAATGEAAKAARRFAAGERPRTTTRLRSTRCGRVEEVSRGARRRLRPR
ncbi:MAG: hypothetical protein V4703_01160, partial [Actinomycetota bacterium]